jgi:hypothetical protein
MAPSWTRWFVTGFLGALAPAVADHRRMYAGRIGA